VHNPCSDKKLNLRQKHNAWSLLGPETEHTVQAAVKTCAREIYDHAMRNYKISYVLIVLYAVLWLYGIYNIL
jgi:hypothetical protein